MFINGWAIVAGYHRALLEHGAPETYDLDACWDDYVYAMFQAPLITVFGCAYGTQTERGDRMFATMATRACAAIRDHDALRLLGGGAGTGPLGLTSSGRAQLRQARS